MKLKTFTTIMIAMLLSLPMISQASKPPAPQNWVSFFKAFLPAQNAGFEAVTDHQNNTYIAFVVRENSSNIHFPPNTTGATFPKNKRWVVAKADRNGQFEWAVSSGDTKNRDHLQVTGISRNSTEGVFLTVAMGSTGATSPNAAMMVKIRPNGGIVAERDFASNVKNVMSISRRHPGEKTPGFYICYDQRANLNAQPTLNVGFVDVDRMVMEHKLAIDQAAAFAFPDIAVTKDGSVIVAASIIRGFSPLAGATPLSANVERGHGIFCLYSNSSFSSVRYGSIHANVRSATSAPQLVAEGDMHYVGFQCGTARGATQLRMNGQALTSMREQRKQLILVGLKGPQARWSKAHLLSNDQYAEAMNMTDMKVSRGFLYACGTYKSAITLGDIQTGGEGIYTASFKSANGDLTGIAAQDMSDVVPPAIGAYLAGSYLVGGYGDSRPPEFGAGTAIHTPQNLTGSARYFLWKGIGL